VDEWAGWMVAGYPDSMLTGQGFIVRSTDGGLTWDSLYQSLTYEDFFDVHFFNQLDGIVVGGDEADTSVIILKTTDGGFTWNPISAPANSYYLRAVDFVGDEGWAVGRFGTIIHTTNSGNSWTFQTSPATNTLFDVDFSDNLHGFACGQGIILYTTDGGQNWIQAGIEEHQNTEVETTNLSVYPNPFRQMTEITLKMIDDRWKMEDASLNIYDANGRLIKVFNLQSVICNLQSIKWSGTDQFDRPVPPGVYFIKLETPVQVKTEKVVLLK